MSSAIYSITHKRVRLLDSQTAWTKGKNGKQRLNPNYHFIGKIDMHMPNMIITASDKVKPKYKGDINSLNRTAKGQIVDHFFNNNGKRNRKSVAYLAVKK